MGHWASLGTPLSKGGRGDSIGHWALRNLLFCLKNRGRSIPIARLLAIGKNYLGDAIAPTILRFPYSLFPIPYAPHPTFSKEIPANRVRSFAGLPLQTKRAIPLQNSFDARILVAASWERRGARIGRRFW